MPFSSPGFLSAAGMTLTEANDVKEELKDIIPYCETSYTPDMPSLNRWDSHYIFVFDETKHQFSKDWVLADDPIVGVGYTKAPWFTMYRYKNENRFDPPLIMVRQSSETAGAIYGEIYQVPSSLVADLDEIYGNTVWTKRLRIPIEITRIYDRKKIVVQAWAWIAQTSVWKDRMGSLEQLPLLTANADKNFKYYNFMKIYDKTVTKGDLKKEKN